MKYYSQSHCKWAMFLIVIYLLWVDSAKEKENQFGPAVRRFRRQINPCQDGNYTVDGKTCCLCAAGQRLTKVCEVKPEDRDCEFCEAGTYNSKPNSEPICEPCTSCAHPNEIREMKTKRGRASEKRRKKAGKRNWEERNFGFDSLKSRLNRNIREKGIVARDCLPPEPRLRAATAVPRGGGGAPRPHAGGAPRQKIPGNYFSSISLFNLDFSSSQTKVPFPQFLLNHGRDNLHYESRCVSTGNPQMATFPSSSSSSMSPLSLCFRLTWKWKNQRRRRTRRSHLRFIISSGANLAVKEKCTIAKDAVCRCKQGYFCLSDPCISCNPCKKCEEADVEQPCTGTKDTVCKEKSKVPEAIISVAVIAVLVIAVIAAAIGVCVKRKRFCFKTSNVGSEENDGNSIQNNSLALLRDEYLDEDRNFSKFIPSIAKLVGWLDMKNIAMADGFKKTSLDNIQLNNPADAEEQTISLLTEWEQKHGREAARMLMKGLLKNGKHAKKQELQAIIWSDRSK